MPYTAVVKRVSRQLSDDIDEWHMALLKRGLKLSKEDVSIIMSVALRHDGGSAKINIVVKELPGRHKKVTHRIDEEPYALDILNKEIKLVID